MPSRVDIDEVEPNLFVVRFPPVALSNEEFEDYLRDMDERVVKRATARAIVMDATRSQPVSAAQRKRQAEWMKERQLQIRDKTVGMAFVFTSGLVRGGMTAILWLAPLPCPHHVTGELDSALQWCREQLDTVRRMGGTASGL